MRHNVKGRKLGRTSSHRKATLKIFFELNSTAFKDIDLDKRRIFKNRGILSFKNFIKFSSLCLSLSS